MGAPDRPAARPANSCRTDKAPALALGKVRPLPRPTTTQAPKIAATDTPPTASRPSPATRPAQATSLPAIIMVVSAWRAAKRPARKLPRTNPAVVEPMAAPRATEIGRAHV